MRIYIQHFASPFSPGAASRSSKPPANAPSSRACPLYRLSCFLYYLARARVLYYIYFSPHVGKCISKTSNYALKAAPSLAIFIHIYIYKHRQYLHSSRAVFSHRAPRRRLRRFEELITVCVYVCLYIPTYRAMIIVWHYIRIYSRTRERAYNATMRGGGGGGIFCAFFCYLYNLPRVRLARVLYKSQCTCTRVRASVITFNTCRCDSFVGRCASSSMTTMIVQISYLWRLIYISEPGPRAPIIIINALVIHSARISFNASTPNDRTALVKINFILYIHV